MELLDHPLEAVAFRLYSLPEASVATGAAAWTCLVAVVAAAAAAGLWRLRSSTHTAVTCATNHLELDPSPAEEKVSPEPLNPSKRSPEPAWLEATYESPAPSPKERYAAYYQDAGCVGCCDVEDDDGDDDEVEREDDNRSVYVRPSTEASDPFGWEVVRSLPLSPTAAEVGRYRSPTALGGSVVRLWDQQGANGGFLTPAASPRRRGRVGGAVSSF